MNLGEYEDLGYDSWAQVINIDDALIRGAEVAGRFQIIDALALRGNYTYTDSRQLSGSQEGQPLTNTAEHMSNITLDWDVNTKLNVQLTSETRSARFRGVDDDNDPLYYKDYRVLHLGATYAVNSYFSVYGRINNLLDQRRRTITTMNLWTLMGMESSSTPRVEVLSVRLYSKTITTTKTSVATSGLV